MDTALHGSLEDRQNQTGGAAWGPGFGGAAPNLAHWRRLDLILGSRYTLYPLIQPRRTHTHIYARATFWGCPILYNVFTDIQIRNHTSEHILKHT